MKRIILLLIIAAIRISSADAMMLQDPPTVLHSGVVQQVDGTHYFFHHVNPGQTLYSIARAYSVTQQILLDANADLAFGLKADQIIRIPAFKHTVRARETIFGLSRLYGIEVDQVYAHNPNLREAGLKEGQAVFLPGLSPDVPSQDELMAGISQAQQMPQNHTGYEDHKPPLTRNDSVMLEISPLPQQEQLLHAMPCPQAKTKDTYHVALLIPLFLNELPKEDQPDSLDAGVYHGLPQDHKSFSFLPYYHGVLLALDSIRNYGIDVRLHVFDVGEEEHMARQVVSSPGFASMDLIIGPFYTRTLSYISNYALANGIPVVSPLLPDKEQLRGFPNLFKATPSLEIQLNGLAAYLSDKHRNDQILIVHNNQPQAISIIQAFKANLVNGILARRGQPVQADNSVADVANVNEIIYLRESMSGLVSKLQPGKKNIIVTLIGGEAFLSGYLRELNLQARRYDIQVIGVPDWKYYQSLEIDYLQSLHVHIFSPDFYDYQEANIKQFVKKYRDTFKTEPTDDAFKSANTAFFFFRALALYGRNFYDCLDQVHGIQNDMHFVKPLGDRHGWENDRHSLFRYEDYMLKRVY